MPKIRKSWREKLLDDKDLPKVFDSKSGKHSSRWGSGMVVVPRPRDVDAWMKRIPKGKLTTVGQLREAVARQYGTDTGCPMTTGIFAWIAAHAAEEDRDAGRKPITPYWRTLKAGGEVNPKYPGGVEAQTRLLEAEDHRVVQKGKRTVVDGFEAKVVVLG